MRARRAVRRAYLHTLTDRVAAGYPVHCALELAERAWDHAVARQRAEGVHGMSSQYPPGFVHHLRTLIRQRTDALEAIVDIASPTLLDEPTRCPVRLASSGR